jgi:hypothetical protein
MTRWIVVELQGTKYLLEQPHIQYYEFASRNFIKHQNLFKVVEQLRKNENALPKQEADNAWFEFHETMINVLLYGALSLEAYMNYYAKMYDIPFNNDFESNLSTLNKWKIYPTLKLKKTIDGGKLKKLKEIFVLRDGFVHPKPERVVKDPSIPYKGKSAGAILEKLDKGQLLADINSIYQDLFKIDQEEQKAHDKAPWLCTLNKR